MATDILLSDLTDGSTVAGEWSGNGVFDVLMKAVNDNIKIQYDAGRLTGTDYANVYLGSVQSVIAQSMQYVMQEKEVEARVDLVAQQTLTEAENTANAVKQGTLLDTEEAIKEYELANILPEQVLKLQEEVDLLQSQDVELQAQTVREEKKLGDELLTATKQRQLLSTQEEAEQYKIDVLLPKEAIKADEEIDLLRSQDAEVIASTAREDLKVKLSKVERGRS